MDRVGSAPRRARSATASRAIALAALITLGAACSRDASDGADGSRPARTSSTEVPAPTTTGPDVASGSTAPSDGPEGTPAPKTTAGAGNTASIRFKALELFPEDPSPGGQLVWIENLGSRRVDLGCWTIQSAATSRMATVVPKASLDAGSTIRLAFPAGVVKPSDTISLAGTNGDEVDATPPLNDTSGDDQVWHRGPDSNWLFGRTTFSGSVIDGRLSDKRPSGC